MERKVVVYCSGDWWVAECPSLPSCGTQGETEAEALANIKGVIHRVTAIRCGSSQGNELALKNRSVCYGVPYLWGAVTRSKPSGFLI